MARLGNEDVARFLEDVAAALELKEESAYRIRAYQDAARHVAEIGADVMDLHKAGELTAIPGVGASIAEKIAGFLATGGRSPYLDGLIREIPRGVFELLEVPGIGPAKANALYRHLKITSLPELAEAARRHRVREVPGMGEKFEQAVLREIGRLGKRQARLPLGVAWPLAERVQAAVGEIPTVCAAEAGGSIRRRKETVGDVDLLVATQDPALVEQALPRLAIVKEVLWSGPARITFLTADDFQVDLRLIDPATWGAALLHWTGSKAHSIKLRQRALDRGLKLNEYGLFREGDARPVAARTEADMYEALGLAWIPPELREDRGEIEAAAADELPALLALEDVRGDFHVHSTWSDGKASIEAMARGAIARGYAYLVVTDHSYGLGVTRGLDPARTAARRREIAALNEALAPFRILDGVELEVRANGDLDFGDDELARFDWVTASIHQGLKQDEARITARMQGALANPLVRTLNHPSGRLLSRRPAYDYDLGAIILAARRHRKALEVNGSYDRMDLDALAARQAHAAGVKLSLGSDAHSVAGLADMRLAVAIARRAWLTKADVLNTRTLKQLLRTKLPA